MSGKPALEHQWMGKTENAKLRTLFEHEQMTNLNMDFSTRISTTTQFPRLQRERDTFFLHNNKAEINMTTNSFDEAHSSNNASENI